MRILTATTLAAALASASAVAQLDATPQTRLDAELRCLLGSYALSDGRSITINGVDGQPRGFRYTLSNGQFGTLKSNASGAFADAILAIDFAPCTKGTLKLTQSKAVASGSRMPLIEKETAFVSDGVKLNGKLVLPISGKARYAAIWIEGSNNNPSTDDSVWQYELARRGIAVFVYDKRGTGASQGVQTSDFDARARDTIAAVKETRRIAPSVQRIGVIGASQGGWVAPLTASNVSLDFVISAFGMAEGPIAQDRVLVQLQVREAGFGDAALAEASELAQITERIVRSGLTGAEADKAFADLDAFKAKHANAPWLKAIEPRSYTGLFLMFSTEQIKSIGPAAAQGLTFDFEPRPLIETIKPRQLWLLAGSDRQAPSAGTQAILREIQQKRRDVFTVVFPNADHGLVERLNGMDGAPMGYSPRLFDITADWIKGGKLSGNRRFAVIPSTN